MSCYLSADIQPLYEAARKAAPIRLDRAERGAPSRQHGLVTMCDAVDTQLALSSPGRTRRSSRQRLARSSVRYAEIVSR